MTSTSWGGMEDPSPWGHPEGNGLKGKEEEGVVTCYLVGQAHCGKPGERKAGDLNGT